MHGDAKAATSSEVANQLRFANVTLVRESSEFRSASIAPSMSEVETPSENVRLDRVCSSNLLLDRGMNFCYGAGVSTCTRSHRQSQNFRDLSERELTVDFQMNNLMLLLRN